jgi:Glycosyl hydrolases family 16
MRKSFGHCKVKMLCALFLSAIATVVFTGNSALGQQPRPDKPAPPPQAQGYKLVFADDFDRLDLSPDGRGIHEWYEGIWFNHQHASRKNISVANSMLCLKWERGQGAVDTSITTFSPHAGNYGAWRYGYFEARLRWDVVKGTWPAFWLIPVEDATGQDIYNGTKESGEIDIFEGQGDHPHVFYGTIHDWVNLHDHANRNNFFALPGNVDLSQFHTYGLLWTPGKVTWYLDNQPLHSESTPAIFDRQDFFLVLTMQEGDDWKAGNLSGVTASSMTLNVDWVRVWQP